MHVKSPKQLKMNYSSHMAATLTEDLCLAEIYAFSLEEQRKISPRSGSKERMW